MKDDLKSKLLTKDQIAIVEEFIIDSLKNGFLNSNNPLPSNFYEVTSKIASDITHNVQMALSQKAVFTKVLKDDKKKVVKKKK